ncbi:hypothetical protein U1Q18_051576 [Sarracenia purpurea var. burkii]
MPHAACAASFYPAVIADMPATPTVAPAIDAIFYPLCAAGARRSQPAPAGDRWLARRRLPAPAHPGARLVWLPAAPGHRRHLQTVMTLDTAVPLVSFYVFGKEQPLGDDDQPIAMRLEAPDYHGFDDPALRRNAEVAWKFYPHWALSVPPQGGDGEPTTAEPDARRPAARRHHAAHAAVFGRWRPLPALPHDVDRGLAVDNVFVSPDDAVPVAANMRAAAAGVYRCFVTQRFPAGADPVLAYRRQLVAPPSNEQTEAWFFAADDDDGAVRRLDGDGAAPPPPRVTRSGTFYRQLARRAAGTGLYRYEIYDVEATRVDKRTGRAFVAERTASLWGEAQWQ